MQDSDFDPLAKHIAQVVDEMFKFSIVAFIAQFFVWLRIVVSPSVVIAAWEATKDGKITSDEAAEVLRQMDFEIRVPFAKWFRTEPDR